MQSRECEDMNKISKPRSEIFRGRKRMLLVIINEKFCNFFSSTLQKNFAKILSHKKFYKKIVSCWNFQIYSRNLVI